MKKIFHITLTALIIFFLPISVYAYVIGSSFIIENQTDKNFVASIVQPDNGNPIIKEIPAKNTVSIYVENGDTSGLLYQAKTLPFSITEAATGIEQVNGRIAFYVGASMWNKYSFLDSVLTSPSIQVKQLYSCDNGGYAGVFKNGLVISGNPDGVAAPAKLDNQFIQCKTKLESSSKPSNTSYVGVCTGNKQIIYNYDPVVWESKAKSSHCHWRLEGAIHNSWDIYPNDIQVACSCPRGSEKCDEDEPMKKEALDKIVADYQLCYEWKMNL